MSKTFNDGLDAGIEVLSNYTPTTRGEFCSSAELRKVAGPTFSNKLYIEKLKAARKKGGTFEAGIKHAISIMEGLRVEPDPEKPGAWGLVPCDAPAVNQTLFSAVLKRTLNPDG